MAKQVELIMPKMGESIQEATILKWLKKEGDSIEMDESVLEIATDKVDSEVPSPSSGTLKKLLYNEGDVVAVGKPIAIIDMEGGGANDAVEPIKSEPAAAKTEVTPSSIPQPTAQSSEKVSSSTGSRFYSPLVLNIARSEGINMDELEKIEGSGNEGRVTKKDILAHVSNRKTSEAKTETAQAPAQSKSAETSAPKHKAVEIPTLPGDEIIEMDRMRKLIADHMVMSKHTSPHVTSFVEADVTNIVNWREKNKKSFEKREGEKITYTPIFIEAVVKAIKDFPMINIALSENKIVKRKQINIGMAAALPSGNLIVPVIKNADQYNLVGLTKVVNDLANRSRTNQLKPDDIQGGTFTITNVGTFGNVMGTPIINQPQVAILAVGAIRKKPVVLETEYGDIIAVRQMMFLSLSYDHRIVDGMLGGSFLKRIADNLEAFNADREI